jgi:hypothetical protein
MHESAPPVITDPQDRPLSAMAVASLVFGLLLCLPGAGLPGVICGAIGLSATGANGARRGRGLAVSGLVISVIAMAGWIVAAIVAQQVWSGLIKPSMEVVMEGPDRTLTAAFAADGTAFESDWMPGRAPTESERAAFVSGVTLVLGTFQGGSIEEGAQPPAESMSGGANDFDIPWSFTFSEGIASGVVTYRPSRQGETTPGGAFVAIDAIEIEGPDGTRFRLTRGRAADSEAAATESESESESVDEAPAP